MKILRPEEYEEGSLSVCEVDEDEDTPLEDETPDEEVFEDDKFVDDEVEDVSDEVDDEDESL